MSELLLHERQTLIRRRLAEQGRVIAADLAREFAISEDTIRRDLREMAAAGLCKRVYGGALPLTPDDNSISRRLDDRPERKEALARAAVRQFSAGTTLFIDAGSTNLAIARAIPDNLPLTVITNAPIIATALMDHAAVDVVMIGGRLDRRSGAMLGARAAEEAMRFHPDLCVLGSCGLDPQCGVTASAFEEAEFKHAVASRSRHVLAAVTNDKLGVPAAFPVIPLADCGTVVVEHDAKPDALAFLEGTGARLIRAGPS